MEKFRKEMTPQDHATLKTKRLTLLLDLDEVQEAQVYEVLLAETERRQTMRAQHKADKEAGKELSKDEFVKLESEKLDCKIELKNKMKTILTEEQYAKFEALKPKKRERMHRRKRQ